MDRALFIRSLIVLFVLFQVACSENRKQDATPENSVLVQRPEVLSIVPNEVANNNLPVVSGTAQPLVIVKFYSDSNCTNQIGVGNADEAGNYSAIAQVPDDSTTDIYANSFNGLYYSPCSTSYVTYVEDSSSIRPVFQSVSPTSPANENEPVVTGTAEENATVRIYSTSNCTGTVLASGTADADGNFSITVPVNDDTTTVFRAQATDLIGNISPCSNGLTYVEDSTGIEPIMISTLPVGPANDNSPRVRGTAERLSTVRIYTDDSCTTQVASGTASNAATLNFSITVPAVDDTSNEYWGQITDRAGNVSECSSTSVVYIEDSTAPNVPVLVSKTPVGMTDINEAELIGTAEADSEISIHKTNDCSDTAVTTATTDSDGDFTATVTVLDNEPTQFWATATDTAGNESSCSVTSLTHTAYSIPVGMAYLKSTATVDGTNFNSSAGSIIEWSESEFHSTYYEHSLTANPEQLKVKVAGDYMVHLTVPFNTSAVAAQIRNDIRVNGVPVNTARAESAYFSNQAAHGESSNHISILLPGLNVDDVIDVTTTGTGGVGNITATATAAVEFIPTARNIFFGTATQTSDSTNLNQTTTFPLQWTTSIADAHYSNFNGLGVWLNATSNYLVHVNVPVESLDGGTSVKVLVRLNGTTIPYGVASQGYIANSSSSIHWSGVIPAQSGDVLSVETVLAGETGVVSTPLGSLASLYIEDVGSSGVFSSTATSTTAGNWNSASAGSVIWSGSVFDSAYFSESGSNPERIIFEQDGDYMVSFTAPFYSTSNFVNIRSTLRLNGTAVNGAESKTSFLSFSNAHRESSNNMTYLLRRVSDSLYLSVGSQREGNSGAVSTNAEAGIFIQYKPNSTTP